MTTTTTMKMNGSKSLHDWFTAFQDGKVPSTLNHNPKLNAEIHLAIIKESSEYISSICDHLFTLHHDVKHRPFVLQFLPSFVTAYYDVLYYHSESIDARTKDVCSTIDTFLVSLYNLSVTDDILNEKLDEFRIPNLTLPSIYHTPNPDHYAPTPLTQHEISKHDTKCDIIRLQEFTPFDSVNGLSREQILRFLLIQYGSNVSSMDKHSRQSYIQMSKKLLGQGFSFDSDASPTKSKSILPPTGRRIHVSSLIMSEILGTLFYLKSNSSDNEASDCMRLLKHRAEYEMYADVILMTESMGYLHEFESQRSELQDSIGIEIESAPTIDIIQQKRTARTTRSMKNRQRSSKQSELTVLNPESEQNEISSPIIDEVRTNISSSIGPVISTPSPKFQKPVSLTSTKTYFQHNSSPILPVKTTVHHDDQSTGNRPRASSIKHGDRKETIATVRFTDENGSSVEETYL
jgi:hypothetical protein